MRTFTEIIEELKVFKGVQTDAEIADILAMKPKTLATAKARNSIPFEELASFCNQVGLSLNSLLFKNREIEPEHKWEEKPLQVCEPPAIYNKVKGDPEMAEIIRMLKEFPQDKALVLKLLKGKKDIKEALEGFEISRIKEQEG